MQSFLQDLMSGDLVSRQLTTVRTLNIGLKEGFAENAPATLILLAVILFLLAIVCRYTIYTIVRITGREKYDGHSRALENLWAMIALAFGIAGGDVCFQNLWLAGLTGGAFAIISIGAVVEALVANEKSRISRLSQGLRVESKHL